MCLIRSVMWTVGNMEMHFVVGSSGLIGISYWILSSLKLIVVLLSPMFVKKIKSYNHVKVV